MSYVICEQQNADQPAHPRSLISASVVRCLDSIISLDPIAEISRLYLGSVAEQANLSLTWLETPEDRFSCDVAHIHKLSLSDATKKSGSLSKQHRFQ